MITVTPDLRSIEWNSFNAGPELVEAGEAAALAALPTIQAWLSASSAKPLPIPDIRLTANLGIVG